MPMMQQKASTRFTPPQWLKRCMRDYKIYAVRSSQISASAVAQNVSVAFDHSGYIFAINATAQMISNISDARITPATGNRDAFTILFKKANSEVLVTAQVAAVSLFGIQEGPLELVRPWPITRSQAVIAVVDNLVSTTALVIDITYHLAVTEIGSDQ